MNHDSDTRSNTPNVIRHCIMRKRDRRKKEYWKLPFMRSFHVYVFLSCFLFFGHSISGFVIAPPWANPEVNRCSKKSWQLIYWPQDDRCYQIFEQGPCPRSQVRSLVSNTAYYNLILYFTSNKSLTFYQCRIYVFVSRSWDSTKSLVKRNVAVQRVFFIGQQLIVATKNIVEDHVKLTNI